MEALVAKLLVPFAVLLGLSALGIAMLALSARSSATGSQDDDEAPFQRPAAPLSGGAPRRGRFIGDEREAPHQTLVIDRRSAREAMGPVAPRPHGPHDLRDPDADLKAPPRGPSPGMARPAEPQRPSVPAAPRSGAERRDDSAQRPSGVRPFDLADRGGRSASDLQWERDDSPPPRPRDDAEPMRDAGGASSPRNTGSFTSGRPSAASPPPRPSAPPAAKRPAEEAPRPRPLTHETNALRSASPDSTVRAARPDFGPPTVPPARRDIFDSTRPQGQPTPPAASPKTGRPLPPRETRSVGSSDGTAEIDAVNASDAAAKSRDSGGLGRGRAGGESKFEPSGVNIVLQQPINPRAFVALPGRLEVVYGNFSPQDPREIPLLWPVGDNTSPRYVFSKSPGDTIGHIQLNHYTITSGAQADLTFENGRHTLGNLVSGDEMDRYQIRVNGVPMGLGERLVLHSGDIISMGIYRLKLTI